jgi:hypothetical protein
MIRNRTIIVWLTALMIALLGDSLAQSQPIEVEGQPLAGNVRRLLGALEYLGYPVPDEFAKAIEKAANDQDAKKIQELLDPHMTVLVHLNPEARVKAKRGLAPAILQQGGYTPILIKVHNESTVTKQLKIGSPQALPIHSRGKAGEIKDTDVKNRFLDLELFTSPPMSEKLSGLKVEYALALIHSSQAGKREATIIFDVGQGTQDLGFRGEVPVLFDIRPAIPVKLIIEDFDGTPTTGRFTFKDKFGRVYPPKAKRLAPDFFFQDQVYRHSGGIVLLPPGELTMTYGRGPEYRMAEHRILVPDKLPAKAEMTVTVKLQRWVNPRDYGFYSGDHHIHAAGCAHYTNPTEGVFAEDMFLHVKGEGLNVGCNLTWGPCYDFQRQFFEPNAHKVSEPFTVLKYDVEVSGFGSQALGHVCLLNLRDQTYPGSEGTKTKGWPTWTTPLMRWAKNQGAYTGYAHSASGLGVNPKAAALRVLVALDLNKDGKITAKEAELGLLPDTFKAIDTNNDGFLTLEELTYAIARVTGQLKDIPARLPNYAIPEMDGIGAQEIAVTTAQGLCDFISAMDTNRVPEWNCWYHLMNCGYPLRVSGETDFPCITGSRVGQGRVYVQLGTKIQRIEFKDWAEGLAKGRSYVSDGYAHALQFTVDDKPPGDKVKLQEPGKVTVKARVAFAADTPLGTAVGGSLPDSKTRLVEIIVNGKTIATQEVPADDKEHDLTFFLPIEKSSWVALRQFPQLHTNPVEVIVGDAPIRASRKSALWAIGTIDQLWRVRGEKIAPDERAEADRVFQWTVERYRKIAEESPPES